MNSFTQFVAFHSISLKVFLQVKVFFFPLLAVHEVFEQLPSRAASPARHVLPSSADDRGGLDQRRAPRGPGWWDTDLNV